MDYCVSWKNRASVATIDQRTAVSRCGLSVCVYNKNKNKTALLLDSVKHKSTFKPNSRPQWTLNGPATMVVNFWWGRREHAPSKILLESSAQYLADWWPHLSWNFLWSVSEYSETVCVVSALPDLIPNPTYGTAVNPTFGGEASTACL